MPYVDPDQSRRNVLVPTFESKRKDPGHRWLVQPLEMWRGHGVNAGTARLNVIKVSDPLCKDPFDIFGVELGQRPNFRLWSEVPSDLNGTFELERQCLCNVHFPCLCLLDARQERGFVGVQGRGVHVPDRLLTFVSRKRDLP